MAGGRHGDAHRRRRDREAGPGQPPTASLALAHMPAFTSAVSHGFSGGFDFLGYRFGPNKLSLAPRTIELFVARAIRLFEQEPGEADASARFGLYVRRWVRWAEAGLPDPVILDWIRLRPPYLLRYPVTASGFPGTRRTPPARLNTAPEPPP